MGTMRLLIIAIALAIACAAALEGDEQVPPLVEALSQENDQLYDKTTALFEELVQVEDPILHPIFEHANDGEPAGSDPIITDAGGEVDNGDDSFLHGHTGDGFPQGGYPEDDEPRTDPIVTPDSDHKLLGYDRYKDPVMNDAHINRPVYGLKSHVHQDPILGGSHPQHVDIPAPTPSPMESDHDFSEEAIKDMDAIDHATTYNQTQAYANKYG